MSTFLTTTLSDIILQTAVTDSSQALMCQNYQTIIKSNSMSLTKPFFGILVNPNNPQRTYEVQLLTEDQYKEKVQQLATLWNNHVKAEGFDLWIPVAAFAAGFSYFVAPSLIVSGNLAAVIVGVTLLIGTIVSIAKVILNARETYATKKKAAAIPRLITELAQQHVVKAQQVICNAVENNKQKWTPLMESAFAMKVFTIFANRGDAEGALKSRSLENFAADHERLQPDSIKKRMNAYTDEAGKVIMMCSVDPQRGILINKWKIVYLTIYGSGHEVEALKNARGLLPLPTSSSH